MNRFRLSPARITVSVAMLTTSMYVAEAQSTGTLRGTLRDASGAVVSHACIEILSVETGLLRTAESDGTGEYAAASLPPGTYTVTVHANGMADVRQERVIVSVGRDVSLNFSLKVAETTTTVVVNGGESTALDVTSAAQSQTLTPTVVQEVPLNGRHFIDLFPLVAGTVTPPATGSLSAPTRGTGASGFNSAGYREDMTNLMINGIAHTDLQQNQIAFQPTINIVSEFKVDNSVPNAEYGRSAGVIVSVATHTGTNSLHGEVFEFVRNNWFDARNFFNPKGVAMSPFKRNQFGASLGGPLWKNHTFAFVTYEGLRQRQGVTINSGVLTPAQRVTADPTLQKLIALIPQANNATGTAFVGSASAPVNINQWSANLSHNFSAADTLNGFYVFQTDKRSEPTLQGDTVPGFGDQRYFRRQFIALNETHTFSPSVVNEARFGISRLRPNYLPAFQANPLDYGINDGITLPVGLPQITISSIALTIGGPSAYPQYRGDTTAVLNDTLSILEGRHYIKVGGEYRRFISSNTTGNTGRFTFATPAAFLAEQANAFSVTQGFPAARIFTNAVNGFAQDAFKLTDHLTLNAGVRFEWNGAPTEGANRFVAFDPATGRLVPVGGNSGYG
ncbi:MAG: carboxypeptidase regulatory-like domain-containing protein, partial [Janthinobacterium lividum]